MQTRGYIGRRFLALLALTLVALGVIFGLNVLGMWAAIGDTASGIVGMLLGCVVLFAWLETL